MAKQMMPHKFRLKVEMTCEGCGGKATKYVGAKFCSDACRQKAHRDRRRGHKVVPR